VRPETKAVSVAKEGAGERSHRVLWIVAGAVLAGGLGAGGYLLYQASRSPSSATIQIDVSGGR
jgi:hypothetical protein